MGRRIPAKKHRGVTDPFKQQQVRLKALQDKINAPPTNPDDQPIPKSLTRLFEYKERFEENLNKKLGEWKQRKQRKIIDRTEDTTPDNPVANMKMIPGESHRDFTLRINLAVKGLHSSQQQVEAMERCLNSDNDPKENERQEKIAKFEGQKLRRKLKKQKFVTEEKAPKLSRTRKATLKKERKKESRIDVSAPIYDTVKFGEVAHAPPSLLLKPRQATVIDGAPRPGRKDLLLNKILLPSGSTDSTTNDAKTKTVNAAGTSFDKKAKRRSLPIAVRLRLEQSQQEAIDAYKAIKLAKIKEAIKS